MNQLRNLKIVPVPAEHGKGREMEVRQRVNGAWVAMRPRTHTRIEAIALRNLLADQMA